MRNPFARRDTQVAPGHGRDPRGSLQRGLKMPPPRLWSGGARGLWAACLWLCAATAGAQSPGFAWPDGQRAAVSLAYDDALDSQLDHAIPALDRHGFKGSFYLTMASDVVVRRLDGWRAAAANGHELGNHSLFHQCSGSVPDRDWVAPARDLDRTTVAQMRDQILLANAMLYAIDGEHVRSFTAPCGETAALDGDYLPAVASAFVGSKIVAGGQITDMARLDPDRVPAQAPVDADARALIASVEQAARDGTLINLTFHGIGGDHLAVSIEAHDALLAHLAAHPDVYWVASFRDIMRWVRAQAE